MWAITSLLRLWSGGNCRYMSAKDLHQTIFGVFTRRLDCLQSIAPAVDCACSWMCLQLLAVSRNDIVSIREIVRFGYSTMLRLCLNLKSQISCIKHFRILGWRRSNLVGAKIFTFIHHFSEAIFTAIYWIKNFPYNRIISKGVAQWLVYSPF